MKAGEVELGTGMGNDQGVCKKGLDTLVGDWVEGTERGECEACEHHEDCCGGEGVCEDSTNRASLE